MAISAYSKDQWRSGKVGTVAIASPRGFAAITLVVVGAAILFVPPVLGLFEWAVSGEPAETVELDRGLLALNLALNAVLLVVFPMLAILLVNPGDWGAIAVRLRLLVDRQTALFALMGAAITVAALLLLGTLLASLEAAGLYEAEESALVPQIQALLTPTIIIAVPVVAAVTEEVYFRGFLQPRIGIIGSSLLFALVHAGYNTVLQIVAPFLLGLLFGYLFQRTRSLWTPIAAHFTFDLIQFFALYLLR